ncbi:MAG TPA: AAA family ATPase [Solirubrobacteraceae bacterium]|jgi:chromosome segregation protein|nr:AAA family ATPase [Solirubrobacteraceae bacterium]
MRLKSLTLKGFKSFPDRTRLDFGPGVSVVVGPNGSGKSNVTDAVLWAMGEQSPLAVRGQSMQDVIFGGGRGVQARSAAEVEIVLDNSDGTVDLPLSEISIVRRLDRGGDGGYRLNGARCRLTDVIEVLSDTGLGKEQHSVISQGRVEAIVTSKPRDRRLLIEEAAGLGKHRKRRRRAQLKLDRTQENLDRALDVEREARTRLRPLKRQAEAAELHERLERQLLEARWELACEALRARGVELREAEAQVRDARTSRESVESELQAIVARRGRAETALAERTERHDALSRRAYEIRSARERLQLREEQARASAVTLAERASRIEIELGALIAPLEGAGAALDGGEVGTDREGASEDRVRELESELTELDSERQRQGEREIEGLEQERAQATGRLAEVEAETTLARDGQQRAEERLEAARNGRIWATTWSEVRELIAKGVSELLAVDGERERELAIGELADRAERLAQGAIEHAFGELSVLEQEREQAGRIVRECERRLAEAGEAARRAGWLIEQRRSAPEQGPLAVRRAQLQGELAAERRQAERLAAERVQREQRIARLRARRAADMALEPRARRIAAALASVAQGADALLVELEEQLSHDRAAGERLAAELRACAQEEAEIQARLRALGENVTAVEVAAQRLRDQAAEASEELSAIAERLERALPGEDNDDPQPLAPEEASALEARVQRLLRRREQLGPVNPLAQEEYAEALAHVEELESRRSDLETALRELRTVIRDTDRQIAETFEQTFAAAARNFEELVGDVFPGGSGRLRLVRDEHTPRAVLGGQSPAEGAASGGGDDAASATDAGEAAADAEAEHERERARGEGQEEDALGVEIEITPAGKSTKRLSLLSGGEKSMTALAFLFAVFLARPCPFYILDEVEAALDDLNLDRFLALLRRYSDRAQFIVITHQKRTMEAADWLYGVSMGGDGVSKVLSRRLPPEAVTPSAAEEEDAGPSVAPVAEVA